jgi:GT2 family glycosyltransferase
MKNPPVSISVINYNGERFVKECFSAIFELDYPEFDVIMVDNGSTDSSVSLVQKKFPQVKVYILPENRGPNPARNFALLNARNRYLFLLDNDAIVTNDCLSKLMSTLSSFPDAAICSPLIVDRENPLRVQYGATHIHYIGQAIIGKNRDMDCDQKNRISLATTVNGTALLIDRSLSNQVGFFDEEMFFGWTDGDYSFRMTAAGLRCIVLKNAKVLHQFKKRNKSVVFHQVKNRWVFILKNYSWLTLVVISLPLFFYEIMLLGFLLTKGHLKDYLMANYDVVRSLPRIMEKRTSSLRVKCIADYDLLTSGDFVSSQFISLNTFQRFIVSIVNKFFDSYWNLVKRFLYRPFSNRIFKTS